MSKEHYTTLQPQTGDSSRQLLVKILDLLNQNPAAAGNTSGIQGAYADYGGAAPDWTPSGTNLGIAVDTVTHQIWWYIGSWI